ncbi:coiled-coil domain-containing protein 41 [Streptomyces laurentii]|uniref:Coiled-coil domain-containing protein 41 n=1 Tax=Streptomyces laurentii TaxID=39478 RepID=A0A169NNN2_STRLU|nr:coiled-coil domain-containing protein 41 [Streptomyces laurentii]
MTGYGDFFFGGCGTCGPVGWGSVRGLGRWGRVRRFGVRGSGMGHPGTAQRPTAVGRPGFMPRWSPPEGNESESRAGMGRV